MIKEELKIQDVEKCIRARGRYWRDNVNRICDDEWAK